MIRYALLFALSLVGCASSAGSTDPTSPPVSETHAKPDPTLLPGGCVCGTEPGCPPCPAPSGTASTAPSTAPPADGAFPPKSFAPPQDRTKKPGDGEWSPMAVHKGTGTSSPIYTAIVHPHKVRGDVIVQLVAIDTKRVSMDLVMGTDEPEGVAFAKEKRPGMVSADALESLIAITNGGFKKRHGGHGVGAFGETALEPSPQFCTFAKAKDGAYALGTYSKISPQLADGFQWFRQTPPCLIEDGVRNPDVDDPYKARRWGRSEDGKPEIRRSAVGFAADTRTLYFAIGDWVTPEWLVDGLTSAGIQRAAELDINWSYTRFIVYEHNGPEVSATSPLLKELKAPKKEYIKEASQRDFFTLRWK